MEFIKSNYLFFFKTAFFLIGVFSTLFGIATQFLEIDAKSHGVSILIGVGLAVLVITLALLLKHIKSVCFRLDGVDTEICITFGDVFEASGNLVVPTGAFFDYKIQSVRGNQTPVSKTSVHGQLIEKFGQELFRRKIGGALRSQQNGVGQKVEDRCINPKTRYPLGTVATIVDETDRKKYHLVALTDTSDELQAIGSLANLFGSLKTAWGQIGQKNDMEDIVLPLIGSGFARLNLRYQLNIEILIASIRDYSMQNGIFTKRIEIRLPKKLRGRIRCDSIRSAWS
ncbi:MAG: macro domain-containing protein [Planctomycetota bacterium]